MLCRTQVRSEARLRGLTRHRFQLPTPQRRFFTTVWLFIALVALVSPLRAQPAASNRVLELDGKDSYVELPPNIFTNLTEATVEGWMKWDRFGRYLRFFDSGKRAQGLIITEGEDTPDLHFDIWPRDDQHHPIDVANVLRTNQWFHIAAVSGRGGMKLYVNGVLVGSDPFEGSFASVKNGDHIRLGRDVWGGNDYTKGQMDEVRVWKVARTDVQIRQTMFKQLSGGEPDLVGLWNFEDGTANDSSPGAHHGELMGGAKIALASLPSPVELAPWARLVGKATDAGGTAISGAIIRATVNGVELAQATTSPSGDYGLTLRTSSDAVDLSATAPKDLVGSRTAIALSSDRQSSADLILKPVLHIAGKVVALDGTTAHSQLVLELVRPAGADTDLSANPVRTPPTGPARSVTPNRVLRLPTNSYVELPPRVFEHLGEATIEAWVKWKRWQNFSPIYTYGEHNRDVVIAVASEKPDPTPWLSVMDENEGTHFLDAPIVLTTNTWNHVAAVTSKSGMKFYFNGSLVATNSDPIGFAAAKSGKVHSIGRFYQAERNTLEGELDEFRIWARERTADEIRNAMFQRLTGNEPGLAALWNFDDPAQPGGDASPNHIDGRLIGGAEVVEKDLPSLLYGRITDPAGKPLPGATVEVRQSGREVRRYASDAAGNYTLLIDGSERCDLFVTTGKFSAYRLGFEPVREARQQLDWTLAETQRGGQLLGSTGPSPVAPGAPPGASGVASTSAGVAISPLASVAVPVGEGADRGGRGARAPQLPPGTVVARVLTDESGAFDFPNVNPGPYQLRAQVLDGKAWFDRGSILYAQHGLPGAEAAKLKAIDWRLAPFKKGHWTTWTSRDGLPSNHIRKFWVDPDGVLWIATGGGVSRFDGKEFSNLTTEDGLLSDRVFNLWREPNGIWWFCTARGVSRYDPALASEGRRAFRNFTSQDGLSSGEIHAVTQTANGTMWFAGNTTGLSRFDGEKFFTCPAQGDFTEDTPTMKMTATTNGVLWLGTHRGLIRFDGSNFVNVSKELSLPSSGADSPDVAPDGSIWFAGGEALWRYDPAAEKRGETKFQSFSRNDGLVHKGCYSVHRAADGNLWVATPRGVSRFDGTNFVNFTVADGLADNIVLTITSTPDGTIWFGTWNGGVSQYEPNTFRRFTQADGLPGAQAGAAVQAPEGTLWIASGGWNDPRRGLARYDGTGFEAFLAGVAFPSNTVNDITIGRDGSVWAGLGGGGLAHYSQGRFALLTTQDGLPGNNVTSVAATPNGDLWIALSDGLSRYNGKTFQNFAATNGLSQGDISAVEPDSRGNVWLTTHYSGAFRYDGREFQRYTIAEGLADNNVNAVLPTPEGIVWFGTAGGLTRFDGTTYTNFTKARDRLADNSVLGILRDREGVLWVGGPAGVTRYDGNVWSTLTDRDGLGGKQAWLNLEDKDGAFWIGTENGLTRYVPDRTPPRSPRVTVVADREYTDKDSVAEITAGRRTQFKLSVVDLKTRGETRRYRWQFAHGTKTIDGARNGAGWEPAKRDTQFEWQTNRAGTYTLAVQYIDRDLNYSPPTVLTLKVTPVWYANAFIVVPSGAALLGLIGWAFVARSLVIRRKREAEQLREQLLKEEHAAREAAERARAEIESRNAQLAEANTQLSSAKEAADAANKAKSLFLANMSHEIRTPMNAILGYSQILKRDKELPPKHRQSIETIEKSGDHLLGMINDILDLSKIEAGRMELQASDFDLNDLIAGIEAMFRMRCEEKELKLNVVAPAEGPIPVRGDEGKLRQALINLLGNAVKFTEQGEVTLKIRPIGGTSFGVRGQSESASVDPALAGPTQGVDPVIASSQEAKAASRLTCRRTPHLEGTAYRFDVIDTGPGISEADQKEIFQPFQQSEAGLKKGGTGLGLAITRRQVELMGGEVKLESTLGKGSRFYFEIPLPPAQGQLESLNAKETREVVRLAPGSQVNALVVDDNKNNRDVLSQLLLSIGCRVRVTESALDAFARVKEELPDIIFMDIRMPGMNGAEATKRIIAEHGPDKIKIVAITASVLEHEKAGHMKSGFHSFLSKPFRFPDVCASLKQFLNVEFEYADETAAETGTADEMDASKCSIPLAVWESLKEAADRYSLTALKKAIEPLEATGESGRKAAAVLKRLIHAGDLDRVSAFLEKVKQEGGVA